jgi:hypothetical protein
LPAHFPRKQTQNKLIFQRKKKQKDYRSKSSFLDSSSLQPKKKKQPKFNKFNRTNHHQTNKKQPISQKTKTPLKNISKKCKLYHH